MKFALALASLAACAPAVSGFGVVGSRTLARSPMAFRTPTAQFHATSALSAKVDRLTEPAGQLMNEVDVFIFDCDGVIWRGDSVIDNVKETLAKVSVHEGIEVCILILAGWKSNPETPHPAPAAPQGGKEVLLRHQQQH